MADAAAPIRKITRDDLEAKLREVKGEVDDRARGAKDTIMPFAIGAGVLLLLIAYLLGRRVGRKKSTVVEIRRI